MRHLNGRVDACSIQNRPPFTTTFERRKGVWSSFKVPLHAFPPCITDTRDLTLFDSPPRASPTRHMALPSRSNCATGGREVVDTSAPAPGSTHDLSNQLQQMTLALHQNAFVPTLEDMIDTIVASVRPLPWLDRRAGVSRYTIDDPLPSRT